MERNGGPKIGDLPPGGWDRVHQVKRSEYQLCSVFMLVYEVKHIQIKYLRP